MGYNVPKGVRGVEGRNTEPVKRRRGKVRKVNAMRSSRRARK